MYNERVNFWCVRDDGDRIGTIHFNIECEKLLQHEKSQPVDFVRNFLKEECKILLKELIKQSKLTREEVLDILVPRLRIDRINVTTIKTDKMNEDQTVRNKALFDKISEKR